MIHDVFLIKHRMQRPTTCDHCSPNPTQPIGFAAPAQPKRTDDPCVGPGGPMGVPRKNTDQKAPTHRIKTYLHFFDSSLQYLTIFHGFKWIWFLKCM